MKYLIVIVLFVSTANADDVSLKEYFEVRINEQDKRTEQSQQAARIALEKALLSEIRIQDEESKARYALKEEVNQLNLRVMQLEGSRSNMYVGILILTMLGFLNLIKLFRDK